MQWLVDWLGDQGKKLKGVCIGKKVHCGLCLLVNQSFIPGVGTPWY